MNKITFFLNVILLLAGVAVHSQNVNDKVQIEHNGTWYDGKILKVEGDKYFVTYSDWDESWNEWVTAERLKGFEKTQTAKKYKVGDRVEVEYGMLPEPATIIEVGENKYHIEYDRSLLGRKWVFEKEIKKL